MAYAETPSAAPAILSATPAAPPDSVSVTPVKPSTAPVADSVAPCAAVAAASPTAPISIGNPGISSPAKELLVRVGTALRAHPQRDWPP